ncbi:hypothetical protein CAPTEDRAFT_192008 [Capitella teleta]|uniref:Uncharacterized protein n=1 Tax=Capitella teleta TaxID=283909 RepID=R7TGC8_CAPTE|nr:hypothetical protein CAPTEDRAFT_192008 [Capitella teleta]|eukprot:ELT90621.1 hypothetical protein CAPTEDRAFT_192008 [Capitella teleta]
MCAYHRFLRLWGIMNNAGCMQQILGPLEWQSAEDFKRVLTVNVVGHHNVTKTFLPLVKMTRGRLAFTSSAAGRLPEPLLTLYSASKHAIDGYVSCIRPDLKSFGISSHLIEPGVNKTPMLTQIYDGIASYEVPDDVAKEYSKEFLEKRKAHKSVYDEDVEKAGNMNDIQTLTIRLQEKLYRQNAIYVRAVLEEFASPNCNAVIDAFEHALFGRYPRARYSCLVIAKVVRVLPEYVIDYICNHRNGGKPQPRLIY